MSDPLRSVQFQDAVIEEYRLAVAKYGDASTTVNKLDMFAFAAERIQMRIHRGEIAIPEEDAIHAALSIADKRDGAAADNILAKIARGEIGLELWPDPLLDVVVTLGRGRRKAWKHVTADDLSDMAELRNENTKAARRSERRFLTDVRAVYAGLVSAGSIGEMVRTAREGAALSG